GAADSTVAIQTSLDKCGAAGGGEVVLPQGTFLAAGLSLPNNCVIAGQSNSGNATSLKLKNGANTFLVASSTYIANTASVNLFGGLRNLQLDGNKANNTSGDLFVLRGYRNRIS